MKMEQQITSNNDYNTVYLQLTRSHICFLFVWFALQNERMHWRLYKYKYTVYLKERKALKERNPN